MKGLDLTPPTPLPPGGRGEETAAVPLSLTGRGNRGEGWIPPLLLALIVLLLWEAAAVLFGVPDWLLPAPSKIAATLVGSADLLARHALVTLAEIGVGFAASFVLGVLLAVAISRSRAVERALYPFVVASQTVPVVAIAPLLLIWFGYGLAPKAIVVVLICFFPIVVNAVDGLRSVDPDLRNLLRTMGATPMQTFLKVEAPAALPYLLSGTKVAVSVSVIGAVIGEWVGAQAGLGYLMVRSASQFQTARVFAALVVLALMGIALFGLVALVERKVLAYRDRETERR